MISNAEFESRGVELTTAEAIEVDDVVVYTSGHGVVAALGVVEIVNNDYARDDVVEIGVRCGNGSLTYRDFQGDALMVRVTRQ